jgi:hypothetical protein
MAFCIEAIRQEIQPSNVSTHERETKIGLVLSASRFGALTFLFLFLILR